MTPGAQPIRVAVLGAGTVGAEVANQLLTRASQLEARVGAPLVLAGVAVRDLTAVRHPALPKELLAIMPGGPKYRELGFYQDINWWEDNRDKVNRAWSSWVLG